jgi:hypothetical protein
MFAQLHSPLEERMNMISYGELLYVAWHGKTPYYINTFFIYTTYGNGKVVRSKTVKEK